MRILITGASGFIGAHLTEFLKTKANYLAGSYKSRRPKSSQAIHYLRCDFSSFKEVMSLLKRVRPTHIFHLVGQSSPSLSWKFPLETMRDNAFSLLHLLEACRTLKIKPKILFVSSAHVYGQVCFKAKGPSEKDIPLPIDPYAYAKLQAESFAVQYWKQFQIPTVIVRASAHIGTHQPPVFAISNFCKQIAEIEKKKRTPVLLVGNLKAERGFIAVEDMVRAHFLAIQKCKPGEVYNVAAFSVRPMGEWLDLLLSLTPIRVRLHVNPGLKRVIEPHRLFVNSQKFRRQTGWSETIHPQAVFQNVLNWWRANV